MPERNLLILDIDKTLILADRDESRLAGDMMVGEYRIRRRPYLDPFLAFCLDRFTVAVWSQSATEYVHQIVGHLFGSSDRLAFVWGGERCTFVTNPMMRQYYWVKDLRKVRRLGYRLERVIFIDDTARKLERSYGNLVRVRSFTGDPGDDELLQLMRYLAVLDRQENVRSVEKRYWRESITGEG